MLGLGQAVHGRNDCLGSGQIRDHSIAEHTVRTDQGDPHADATDLLQYRGRGAAVSGDELLDRIDDSGRRVYRGRSGGFAHGREFTVR